MYYINYGISGKQKYQECSIFTANHSMHGMHSSLQTPPPGCALIWPSPPSCWWLDSSPCGRWLDCPPHCPRTARRRWPCSPDSEQLYDEPTNPKYENIEFKQIEAISPFHLQKKTACWSLHTCSWAPWPDPGTRRWTSPAKGSGAGQSAKKNKLEIVQINIWRSYLVQCLVMN